MFGVPRDTVLYLCALLLAGVRHRCRRRHGGQTAQGCRPEVVVQRLRQAEVAEDYRGRRRDGGKNVHAHHVHAQAVPDGIRAHRVSARRVFTYTV